MNGPLYQTAHGKLYLAQIEQFLESPSGRKLRGKVNLLLTSPPFPLNKKKRYGNKQGEEYLKWLSSLASPFAKLLAPRGSIVIEIGNAWEPDRPVQSLLPLQSLLAFVSEPEARLRLCQQFICYNPSRLPSPAQWVTIERVRMTDSFTTVWWMSASDNPKADNRRVLRPYSESMKSLLERKSYNSGIRPSEHRIGKTSFLRRHTGSIMPNVVELDTPMDGRSVRLPENLLSIANTNSNDAFLRECRDRGIVPHPARMPLSLASLFVHFLTEPGDLVFDPFGGSNSTGFVAEQLGRRWIAVEADREYAKQSKLRFGGRRSRSVQQAGAVS